MSSDVAACDNEGWPPRHPVLLRIAIRLLAKAERASGESAVRLALNRRELAEAYEQVDAEAVGRIELLLHEFAATGWVRLILAREREFAGFVDRKPQLQLIDFEALAAWADYQRLADRWHRRLVAHLDRHWDDSDASLKQDLLDHLARSPVGALADLPAQEAMDSLKSLRRLCLSGLSMPRREASARVFHGRSKVLDRRDELLRLLGAAVGQFWETPVQLLVDIPPSFDKALFVENLVTFERMADDRRDDWRRSLLVFAAGFKGSAKRLRQHGGCRIYVRARHGDVLAMAPSATSSVEAVGDWLFGRTELPVRFFGDLDFAGLQILKSLREVFADAQAWRPGYVELMTELLSGRGHLPEEAGKERQTDPGMTGCAYVDEVLLPTMRDIGRFVDQERFEGWSG